MFDLGLRISMVRGRDARVQWLVTVSRVGTLAGEAVNGSAGEFLLAAAQIGVVVRDLRLMCTWVNDTLESHDGISGNRRLGRRFTDVLTGSKAEALEAVMRQVLQSGITRVHEYRAWLATGPRREHSFAASFVCLQGADGKALGVCVISVDVTESRRTCDASPSSERMARDSAATWT
jgi:PAS domain-containing protein